MLKLPSVLQKGDQIAIVAPAGKVNQEKVQAGKHLLESWGLRVSLGKHVFGAFNRFAAQDEQRLEDLQRVLEDPAIKAVVCARGGYGVSRIMDRLNWQPFLDHPKWVVGFSDITALLSEIQQKGVACIHGPMAAQMSQTGGEQAAEHLRKLLFGESCVIQAEAHRFNRPGQVKATVTGGNLSILCHITGTPSELDTKGKILFIEEISEYLYNTDRMMVQLKRAGHLEHLAGLIVGHMTGMKDDEDSFGKQAYEIIREHTEEFDYPVAYGFPAGHEADNYAIPLGVPVKLSVDEQGTTLRINN
jgi:muramoyltetrapeptide carboxypeptidase